MTYFNGIHSVCYWSNLFLSVFIIRQGVGWRLGKERKVVDLYIFAAINVLEASDLRCIRNRETCLYWLSAV